MQRVLTHGIYVAISPWRVRRDFSINLPLVRWTVPSSRVMWFFSFWLLLRVLKTFCKRDRLSKCYKWGLSTNFTSSHGGFGVLVWRVKWFGETNGGPITDIRLSVVFCVGFLIGFCIFFFCKIYVTQDPQEIKRCEQRMQGRRPRLGDRWGLWPSLNGVNLTPLLLLLCLQICKTKSWVLLSSIVSLISKKSIL